MSRQIHTHENMYKYICIPLYTKYDLNVCAYVWEKKEEDVMLVSNVYILRRSYQQKEWIKDLYYCPHIYAKTSAWKQVEVKDTFNYASVSVSQSTQHTCIFFKFFIIFIQYKSSCCSRLLLLLLCLKRIEYLKRKNSRNIFSFCSFVQLKSFSK